MIKEYETFNKNARKYFLDLIQRDERNTDKELFDRCIDEINNLYDKELSRKITKYVRQGKAKRNFNPTRWEQYKNIMKEHNCEDWFIRSLEQVDYLFAKSYGIKLTKKIYKDKVK